MDIVSHSFEEQWRNHFSRRDLAHRFGFHIPYAQGNYSTRQDRGLGSRRYEWRQFWKLAYDFKCPSNTLCMEQQRHQVPQ